MFIWKYRSVKQFFFLSLAILTIASGWLKGWHNGDQELPKHRVENVKIKKQQKNANIRKLL